jgi:hypothetical protein
VTARIKIRYVGGVWHGREREEDSRFIEDFPTWQVEEPVDELGYNKIGFYRSLGWNWMFWPGTISYIARGFDVMQMSQQAAVHWEERDRHGNQYVAAVINKAARALQYEMDHHLYEAPPWSPIIRFDDKRDEEPIQATIYRYKACWIYQEPQGSAKGRSFGGAPPWAL